MINARQYEFLRELKKCPHYVPLRHFAEKFSCSEKTVSVDVKALNLTLASAELQTRVETKAGNGVRMIVCRGEESTLEKVMSLNAGNAMTSFDRFYRGILYLVVAKSESCSLDLLAAYLYTNRRRVQTEIRHWNNVLSFFGLVIKSRKGSLRVEGDEHALRVAVLYFFYMITPHYQRHVIEEGLSETSYILSEKMLDDMNMKVDESYARNALSALRFYADIVASRIQNGSQINDSFDTTLACDEEMVHRIRETMSETLNMVVNVSEAKTISSSQVIGAMRNPRALSGRVDGEAREFAHGLRDAIERRFGYPLDVDTAMALEALSYQVIQRFKNRFPVGLFNAAPMKRYRLDWLITFEGILKPVLQRFSFSLFADDVARMAMLLYPYWDKYRKRTYKALLSADASFEQASYGVHCIETGFPFVRVTGVVSGEDVSPETTLASGIEEDIDFVIAFDPLESSLPVCQISHTVDDDDLMHLMEFVLSLEKPWRGKPFEMSSRKLEQESIRDIMQAVYWDLNNEGIVKASYDEFSEQFRAHCAISTEHMTTAVHLKRTSATGLRVYQTPNFHVVQPISALSVLYVAERDGGNLSEIVARFNRTIQPSARGEHAYSMPPDLL